MLIWLKAVHLVAVLTFVGGTLVAGMVVLVGRGRMDMQAIFQRVRLWDKRFTTPAMIVVWASGLWLGMQGGWFSESWLHAKLAFVLALSGLHGVLSGTLRRVSSFPSAPVLPLAAHTMPATLVSVAAIVMLAVTKPF